MTWDLPDLIYIDGVYSVAIERNPTTNDFELRIRKGDMLVCQKLNENTALIIGRAVESLKRAIEGVERNKMEQRQ